jgi:hypothetical protein
LTSDQKEQSSVEKGQTMATKIIVTHEGAMRNKYGAKWASIKTAVDRLIEADRTRGVVTELVMLDDPALERWQARSAKPSTFKDAIDHVYTLHRKPDYIAILGGPDIIPHQTLVNPLGKKDEDPTVPSDLPYACDAPASDDPAAFVGPSRVVARIPDVPKAADPALLLTLLDLATRWKAPASRSDEYFGLSAYEWRGSTKKSLGALFGSSAKPHLSPTDGPSWTKRDLGPSWHFINCHGAPIDPRFYGQKEEEYPEAHDAGLLPRKIARGTVTAAECCYGAELYDPAHAGRPGICVTYLLEGAIGFMGSTTIAYGPANTNGSADLICRFFLESARGGASLGRALLEARQRFIKEVSPVNPVDLKTLAQFLLLGDPSAHAVQVARKTDARSRARTLRAHAMVRGELEAIGAALTRGVDSVASRDDAAAPEDIHTRLAEEAVAAGYVAADRARTFDVRRSQNASARSLMAARAVQPVRFHILSATPARGNGGTKRMAAAPAAAPAPPAVSRRMILLGHEVAGKLVKIDRLYAHGCPRRR